MTDEEILSLYAARSERAISETENKYGRYLFSIAYNILADDEDCRECVNDALLALWKSVPERTPRALAAYAGRITRNIALNRRAAQSSEKRRGSEYSASFDELAEIIESPSDVAEEYENSRLRDSINRFVNDLSERRRYIFVCRYWCGDSAADIASALGVSRRLVFRELEKIRSDLKKRLVREGFEL
ncbi:MAG: sigma-70 family RNA polymerase sigma factor [Clostridia bacterium]|nr:sigma-70 family RNA polymerase sigma factor [Clostridia bacterium]